MRALFVKSKARVYLDRWLTVVRAFLFLGFDSIVLWSRRTRPQRQEGAIFCLHGLGDLLLAGHSITRLAELMHSRGLQAVLFVHPALVEFARRYFEVDRVEGIDRHRFTRRLSYRVGMLKTVTGRFAMAVQPAYNRMLRVEDYLIRATGAAERIGNAGHAPFIIRPERRIGDRFYTRLIPAQPAPMHELQRYAEFMSGLGEDATVQPWLLPLRQERLRGVTLPGVPYLVLSARASDVRRSWSEEKFLRAARQIALERKLAVVLIGSEKNEFPVRWPDDTGENPDLFDLCGRTATADLPDVLAGAELVISNDSGAYHLGVSLNRPTIAVGGSGLPARYFPYPGESLLRTKVLYLPVDCGGCNWRCIRTMVRSETAWCLQQVSWQELASAAGELLNRKK